MADEREFLQRVKDAVRGGAANRNLGALTEAFDDYDRGTHVDFEGAHVVS
jgi:hypothetical protein